MNLNPVTFTSNECLKVLSWALKAHARLKWFPTLAKIAWKFVLFVILVPNHQATSNNSIQTFSSFPREMLIWWMGSRFEVFLSLTCYLSQSQSSSLWVFHKILCWWMSLVAVTGKICPLKLLQQRHSLTASEKDWSFGLYWFGRFTFPLTSVIRLIAILFSEMLFIPQPIRHRYRTISKEAAGEARTTQESQTED